MEEEEGQLTLKNTIGHSLWSDESSIDFRFVSVED